MKIGGEASAATGSLKAVSTIHKNGIPMSRSRIRSASMPLRRRRLILILTSPGKDEEGDAHGESHEQHEDYAHRGGITEPLVEQAGVVDLQAEWRARYPRTAGGQLLDLLKEPESVDKPQQDDDEKHRPDVDQRHVPEHPEGAGAVHLGGLLQFTGDREQPGEQEYRLERHRGPQARDYDHRNRQMRVAEP